MTPSSRTSASRVCGELSNSASHRPHGIGPRWTTAAISRAVRPWPSQYTRQRTSRTIPNPRLVRNGRLGIRDCNSNLTARRVMLALGGLSQEGTRICDGLVGAGVTRWFESRLGGELINPECGASVRAIVG